MEFKNFRVIFIIILSNTYFNEVNIINDARKYEHICMCVHIYSYIA